MDSATVCAEPHHMQQVGQQSSAKPAMPKTVNLANFWTPVHDLHTTQIPPPPQGDWGLGGSNSVI